MNEKHQRRDLKLNEQISQTKDKNQKQMQKFNEITIKFQEDAESHYLAGEEHKKAKEESLQKIYNQMKKSWQAVKDQNQDKMDNMAKLRQDALDEQRDLIWRLQEKRKKSEVTVEEFKKKLDHKHMLK